MGNADFLPYGRHSIDDEDISAVVEVLRSDALTGGPRVAAFEQAFAAATGARHAVVCNSGTAALHLAALALELGPDDAAIVPSMTFLATANAVRYTGAEVIFADIDGDTGQLSAAGVAGALRRAGNKRVKAVFPVHLCGLMGDIAGIESAIGGRDIRIVEDACHALGGSYASRSGGTVKIGACADSAMAAFSLHPVKAIAMGEGGVVTTNNDTFAERMTRLRGHGVVRDPARFQNADLAFDENGEANPWYYEMPEMGWNFRASDMNCALGLSQLRKLDGFVARRRALAALYDKALAPLAPLVRPAARIAGVESGWHLYTARIDFAAAGIGRAQLMRQLLAEGIGTQVHYVPVHLQPYYRRRYGELSLPGTDAWYRQCLSLPLFSTMPDEAVERVVATLARALGISR